MFLTFLHLIIVGKQFLVRHEVRFSHHRPTEMAFLCLLCAKRLSGDECDAHVFSWEHVVTFLVSVFS